MNERITHWLRRLAAMENDWQKNESHWQELAYHFMSRTHGPLFDDVDKAKQAKPALYNLAGVESLRVLASGMQGGITSPSRPWFVLGMVDDAWRGNSEIEMWLHDTQERMVNTLQRSNFYDQMHRAYYELGAFGNAVVWIEENLDNAVWFNTLNVGRYYMAINNMGVVDTLYRKFKMTVSQMMERWSDKLPETIKSLYQNDNITTKFTVLHVVEPKKDYDSKRKDSKNRPWSSVYILLDGGQMILEEGGYHEKPFVAARWGANYEDTYGYGPASDVLPAAKTLQQIGKTLLKGLQKTVDPPLRAHSSLKNKFSQIGTSPNYVTYVDNLGPQAAIERMYSVDINLNAAEPFIARYEQQVKSGLYHDLFFLLSGTDKRMTATEVAERNAEKMLLLGPTLERLRAEMFEPLIGRVFGIMVRQGKIAKPPDVLVGKDIKIEFVSMLAMAQRSAGIAGVERMTSFVMNAAQAMPEVLDKLNMDKAVEELEGMLGISPDIIRSEDEVNAMREQRAAQQAQMMQQQNAMQAAQMGMQGMQGIASAAKDAAAAGLPVGNMFDKQMIGGGGE